jgi:hypothetical protein
LSPGSIARRFESREPLALFGRVFGANEDLATTEEVGIDGEGSGAKQTEPGRGRQTVDGGDAVEMRQHGRIKWHDQHEGVAHHDKRAANGGEESDGQCDATDAPPSCGSRSEEVSVRRRDGEPGLHGCCDADSPAQQQEPEACPVAWIVQNVSAP